MNKQEVIEKIEACKSPFTSEDDTIFNYGLDKALSIIKQLDEPEKVVVPRCVADMIIKRKKQGDSLVGTLVNLGAFGDAQRWIRKGDNGDTFAKAWLYGYEVEKEKLYTAKLKSTGEYLHYDKDYRETCHQRVPDDVTQKCEGYHFTETDLIAYNAWKNEAYDVKEVKR